MRVRIDKDIQPKVREGMRKNKRSAAREVALALAAYYERQSIKEFLSQKPEPTKP